MALSIPTSGELNKRIELFRRTDEPSIELSAISSDVSLGLFWAKIEPVGAMTFWGTTQQNTTVSHRIWVRRIVGSTDIYSINHGVMIRYKGIAYQPLRVMDANGKNIFTVIECQELGKDIKELGTSLADEVLNG